MESIAIRGGFAGFWAVAAHYSSGLTPVFWTMIIFTALDYLIGMAAAKWFPATPEDGWSSKKGIQGFIKKITYISLAGVVLGVDLVIIELGNHGYFNITWGVHFGIFAMCYLILTEGVSILENAGRMGIEVPFLTNSLKYFRKGITRSAEKGKVENDEHNNVD